MVHQLIEQASFEPWSGRVHLQLDLIEHLLRFQQPEQAPALA
jgi:hypothetical protein